MWGICLLRGCLPTGGGGLWHCGKVDHPVNIMTDTYKNITFLQLRLRAVMRSGLSKSEYAQKFDKEIFKRESNNTSYIACAFILFIESDQFLVHPCKEGIKHKLIVSFLFRISYQGKWVYPIVYTKMIHSATFLLNQNIR